MQLPPSMYLLMILAANGYFRSGYALLYLPPRAKYDLGFGETMYSSCFCPDFSWSYVQLN